MPIVLTKTFSNSNLPPVEEGWLVVRELRGRKICIRYIEEDIEMKLEKNSVSFSVSDKLGGELLMTQLSNAADDELVNLFKQIGI